jgi:hypothetical protein
MTSDDPSLGECPPPAGDADGTDPILASRARVARLTSLAIRAGAVAYAGAAALFALALATRFTGFLASAITLLLVLGSALLAPAMVFHYAVKAADRADRENSW